MGDPQVIKVVTEVLPDWAKAVMVILLASNISLVILVLRMWNDWPEEDNKENTDGTT